MTQVLLRAQSDYSAQNLDLCFIPRLLAIQDLDIDLDLVSDFSLCTVTRVTQADKD